LHARVAIGNLVVVKQWPYILIVLIVIVGAGYLVYSDRQRLGLGRVLDVRSASENAGTAGADSAAILNPMKPSKVKWRAIPKSVDGFTIELPGSTRDSEAPAFNQTGGTEPVKMIESTSGDDTVYAVTWQDNPPVARINNNIPDRTLDQARDGMLARTQTTLMSETRILESGFPGREILARNASGGILNARLIYVPGAGAKDRLYTLMALFPTAGARHEQDVTHFFNSFVMASPGA
jgi:hypothetical protein